jgi:hypothetical protein
MNTDQITTRLQAMTASVVAAKDEKGYQQSRKVAQIVQAVMCGSSAPSRLKTADSILSKWGF